MTGKGAPTAMGGYPHDPEPIPVCKSCGGEVYWQGGDTAYCDSCKEYRDVVSDEEFERENPDQRTV